VLAFEHGTDGLGRDITRAQACAAGGEDQVDGRFGQRPAREVIGDAVFFIGRHGLIGEFGAEQALGGFDDGRA
jgi:hypothetical protein